METPGSTSPIPESSLSSPTAPKWPNVAGINTPSPKRVQLDVRAHLVRTATSDTEKMDSKVAKFVYACNLPFSVAEHPAFIDMVEALRPGYQPPSRKWVGRPLLDTIHKKHGNTEKKIKGKIVTIQQDGWNDIHNDLVVATALTGSGEFFLRCHRDRYNCKDCWCM